jgi:hypothetical protein
MIHAVLQPIFTCINPLSPPSDPVQRRLQSPPAKSNFLAVNRDQALGIGDVAEEGEISDIAKNPNKNYNFYFVNSIKPVGAAAGYAKINEQQAWMADQVNLNDTLDLSAHEIGHLLGAANFPQPPDPSPDGHSFDNKDLMYHTLTGQNPVRIRRRDWRDANPPQ